MSGPLLVDTHSTLGSDMDGPYLHHHQTLDTDFLDSLQSERFAKAHMRAGEMNRVASVPTFVVELWLREGFDVYKESAKAIVARLKKHNLDAFITTNKSV